jgi:hypothetical protein
MRPRRSVLLCAHVILAGPLTPSFPSVVSRPRSALHDYACIVSSLCFREVFCGVQVLFTMIVAQHGLYWVCSWMNIRKKSAYNCIAPGH